MIDRIKIIVETILNKEKVGSITPEQFMNSCDKAQKKIYASYFTYDKLANRNREVRGLANSAIRMFDEKLANFFKTSTVTLTVGVGTLPTDIYFIQPRGVTHDTSVDIDMVSMRMFRRDKSAASKVFPVCVLKGATLEVSPTTISSINIDYYRVPPKPKWTYTLVSGVPFVDSGASDFQDFILHISEETKIITNILSDFGIIKRELSITQLINTIKQQERDNESRLL